MSEQEYKEKKVEKLRFVSMKGNAKLMNTGKKGYIFNLPAGHTCGGALKCLAKAVVGPDGKAKLIDGPQQEFRCFAAAEEARFPSARESRWHNFEVLKKAKTTSNMTKLLLASFPKNADIVRVHSSGDFFNKNYMQAWMTIAEMHPHIIFYAYTKSLNFIEGLKVPNNFKLNASFGGRYDHLIDELNLKHAKVVYSEKEAEEAGYEIDHTDELAWKQDKSFALLIHGNQQAGSKAAKAWQEVKKTVGGYSKERSAKALKVGT